LIVVGIFGIERPLNSLMGNDDRILDRYMGKQVHDSRTLESMHLSVLVESSLLAEGREIQRKLWERLRDSDLFRNHKDT
jgi:hypothetical protein